MPPEAPDNRQVLRLGRIGPDALLPVLAALAPGFGRLIACDLRLMVQPEGGAHLVLPHWNDRPHRPRAEVQEAMGLLAAAVLAVTEKPLPRATDPLSMNLAPALDVPTAALAALRLAAVPGGPDRDPRRLVVIRNGEAAGVAAVARRLRHAVLRVPQGGAPVVVTGDDADGSTLRGLLAQDRDDLVALAAWSTAAGDLWLPEGEALPPVARDPAARVLAALVGAGHLTDGDDLALFGTPDAGLWALAVPRTVAPVPGGLAAEVPQAGLTVTALRVAPSDQASRDLAEAVTANGFPVGYRVGLQALSARRLGMADVDRLRAEIDERQDLIDQLQALAAPQLRLLRFAADQLPALADGLRRMPGAMQRHDGLTFATAHAAGRADPVHFVLYDPARVAMGAMLPEHFWRQATSDSPMAYWLDPHAARALMAAPDGPLVFVPDGSHLTPPLDSFGGALDDALALVLGRLFADPSAVLGRDGARPLYLFSASPDRDFAMEVELLDAAAFAPLHLQLRWLNDHLLVRSPRAGDPAALSVLAEALYAGETAQALAARQGDEVQALTAAWQAEAAGIDARIGDLAAQLAAEVAAARDRLHHALAYLKAGARRLDQVEAAVEGMRAALASADRAMEQVRGLAARTETRRMDFVTALMAELDLAARARVQGGQ